MPAIETGQVKLIGIRTSRIRSLVDGKVAMAKSAQNAATSKPALAQVAIRSFIRTLAPFVIVTRDGLKLAITRILFCACNTPALFS